MSKAKLVTHLKLITIDMSTQLQKSKCPGLNVKHGYLRSIQRQILMSCKTVASKENCPENCNCINQPNTELIQEKTEMDTEGFIDTDRMRRLSLQTDEVQTLSESSLGKCKHVPRRRRPSIPIYVIPVHRKSEDHKKNVNVVRSQDICIPSPHENIFGFIQNVDMLDATPKEIDVAGYPKWARKYVLEADDDPKFVPSNCLESLGKLIVERALSSEGYRFVAAKLCQRIAKKEFHGKEVLVKEASLPFMCSVLNELNEMFMQRLELQAGDGQRWRRYAAFCSDILRRLTFRKYTPKVLCQVTLKISQLLCTGYSLDDINQVSTLTEVLYRAGFLLKENHGPQLDQIVEGIRKKLLEVSTSRRIKMHFMLIMELNASNWTLNSANLAFYLMYAEAHLTRED